MTVSEYAPSIVLPRFTFVPVSVVSTPSVTASPYVCAPVVLTALPLIAVAPVLSVLTAVSFVVPPTTPPNVVVPPSLTVSEYAPLTVLPRFTSVPVSVVSAPSVTALLYVCAPEVVSALVLMVVAPVTVIPPERVTALLNATPPVPAFRIREPLPVLVIAASILIFPPSAVVSVSEWLDVRSDDAAATVIFPESAPVLPAVVTVTSAPESPVLSVAQLSTEGVAVGAKMVDPLTLELVALLIVMSSGSSNSIPAFPCGAAAENIPLKSR